MSHEKTTAQRNYRVAHRTVAAGRWPWVIEVFYDELCDRQVVGMFPSRDFAERCREALEESDRKEQR